MPQLAGGFAWPVEGPIMKRFGEGSRRNHAGIDISAPRGTPIRAARAGAVAHSGWYYDYGNTIIIDHGGGVASLYGHVSKLLVGAGRVVQKGEVIALVGCTGRCTGNHVHFEIRVDGRAVNPLSIGAIADGTSTPRRTLAQTSRAPVRTAQTTRQSPTTRKSVKVAGDTVITTTDTLESGRVVRRVEVTVFAQGQLRVRIVREFRLADAVLKLIKEQARVYMIGQEDGDDEDEDDEA